MIVARLVIYYIVHALLKGVPPWRYFQLNAKYFNAQKGIFSKLEIDDYIPKQWRLSQHYLSAGEQVDNFPVFLKPEWGQNGNGIQRIYSQAKLKQAEVDLKDIAMPYVVQALATGRCEYEIFYIPHPDKERQFVTLTITEVANEHEQHPINSIYNKYTKYYDITHQFSIAEMGQIKNHLAQMPRFNIARVAIKAEDKSSLLSGNFKIIEINLFTPFPLNLFDKTSPVNRHSFIKDNTKYLANLSSKIPREDFKPFLFFKKLRKHYQIQ